MLSRCSCLALIVALAPGAAFIPLKSGMILHVHEGLPPLTQRSALATSTKETISAMTKATQAALQSRWWVGGESSLSCGFRLEISST
jgi:hypothetical protein